MFWLAWWGSWFLIGVASGSLQMGHPSGPWGLVGVACIITLIPCRPRSQ